MTDKNPHLDVPPMGVLTPRALTHQRAPLVETQPDLLPPLPRSMRDIAHAVRQTRLERDEATPPKRSMGDIARAVHQTRLERYEAAEADRQLPLPYEDGIKAVPTAHRDRLDSREASATSGRAITL